MSETGLRERYRAFDRTIYSAVVKGALGFAVLAALPHLMKVRIAGFQPISLISLELLIVTLVYAYAAQSWNIMSGYTGYFSFGHAAFFGTGAYVVQKLLQDFALNPWIGLLIAGVVAALIGLFIGFLTFRYEVQGHYFALTTLAFAVMLGAMVRNMEEFNGTNGYYTPFASSYAEGPGLVAMQFAEQLPYYYLILGFLLVVTVVSWLLKRSQIGLYFFAIKENEQAAQSLGVPVYRFKMLGVGLSAFFTAGAGVFWSMYFSFIAPETVFAVVKNVEILLPAVFGGVGTVAGPILGAFVILPFSELIRIAFGNVIGVDRVIYGIAIILIVLYSPRGLVSWPDRYRDFREWLRKRRGDLESGSDDAGEEVRSP